MNHPSLLDVGPFRSACFRAAAPPIAITALLIAGLPFAVAPALAADAWPEFRGPSQHGYAEASNLPLTWSEEENVVWKTPISHRGWSTPVVKGGQIWLTTATEDGHEMFVYCVDFDSGEVLYREKLFYNEEPEPLGNAVNGYASPTGAIEQGRFFAHFGSYGTAAIDTESFEVLWKRRDLECQHFRGPGSSVIVVDDKLILTMDGVDVQYLAALDTETGETVWKTERSTEWDDYDADGNVIAEGDLRKGYGTPIVYEVNGQRQLASVGAMAAFAYDPGSGEELWTVTFNGYNAASSPVLAAGRVIINTCHPNVTLMAVDPHGSGDITQTNVAWQYSRGAPIKPSPVVVDDELIIFVNDAGVATCLDAQTGEELWKERIGGSYSASPLAASGRVYFFSEEGRCVVVAADREFQVLAENQLDDGFMSSAAAVGDKTLILRTRTHLYRIEE